MTLRLRSTTEVQPFYSEKYQDIYFSQETPEAEKQYVFIEANRIGERIRKSETFTVAELGFGFGLNCALTLKAALKVDCSHKLSFFSVEESFADLSQIRALAAKLVDCRSEYEGLWRLSHTEDFSDTRNLATAWHQLGVNVFHGSVDAFLHMATFAADAWYFDGFSPAKNAAMWSETAFNRAFALTKSGGTFSTYSSAGWVRRNLLSAGFLVEKVAGFAGKREMLVGHKP